MLRITHIASSDSVATLKVEGKVMGPWVEELKQACDPFVDSAERLRLDLSAVSFVDASGLRILRELFGQGVSLTGCSGLIAELLHLEIP